MIVPPYNRILIFFCQAFFGKNSLFSIHHTAEKSKKIGRSLNKDYVLICIKSDSLSNRSDILLDLRLYVDEKSDKNSWYCHIPPPEPHPPLPVSYLKAGTRPGSAA